MDYKFCLGFLGAVTLCSDWGAILILSSPSHGQFTDPGELNGAVDVLSSCLEPVEWKTTDFN